ncbi:MAG: hypothetical protein ACE5F6_00250 [Anaerolineae bacterium]
MKLPEKWPWYLGGAAVLLLVLQPKKAHARHLGPSYDAGVDALTRMILAETGFKSSEPEMAQIIFIALNRAQQWGIPVTQVVNPTGYAPGQAWTTGAVYRSGFERAPTWAAWRPARMFVKRVLRGAYPNMGFRLFVHPGGMPRPPCAANRIEASTIAGRRCIPRWTARGTVVGRGVFA